MMSKLYRVSEEDLVELERIIPEMCDRHIETLTNAHRTKIRRLQTILSNVRWDYGPPTNVTSFPANESIPPDDDEN